LNRKIRVAHCLEQVRSGGVERRRLSLARRLDPQRFEQIVICTEALPELRAEFQQAGCSVFELGRMRRGVDWRKIRAAARLLREFRPDIAHGAVFEGVIVASLSGRLARVPVIVAEEIITPVGRRLTGHLYFRLLTALADKVVAISAAVRDYLVGTIRVPPTKVRLIYNGVAEPQPASADELRAVRSALGIADGAPVIGTLSRMAAPAGHPPDSHKRIRFAIWAMEKILDYFPDARLLIVGDGPDRELLEFHARWARGKVREATIFTGFQHRVRPYLECMDVLVHPAETEGLPLVLVEAMLASRPIVASDVPGSNEVVADGETGFLVPFCASEPLGDKAIELLRDPHLRAKMGAAGLKRARELFSEDRYVREVASLYEELAPNRPDRS
jgi:glycosyltransferase involved in cell wall biosynthesis